MVSPYASALTQLDSSLGTLDALIERLNACVPVDDDQLALHAREACTHAETLRDLVLAERSDANWAAREDLHELIAQLEREAEHKRDQQKRERLVDLATELESGTVKHRFEGRTSTLNTLRQDAAGELRAQAAAEGQATELPGPAVREWLPWAFNLDDQADAAVLAELHSSFPALERFTAEMEDSYWLPDAARHPNIVRAETPIATTTSSPVQPPAETAPLREEAPASQSRSSAAQAARDIPAVPGRFGADDRPSVERDTPIADFSCDRDTATEQGPAFGSVFSGITQGGQRKPIVIAGIAGFALLSIVFFAVIYHVHGKNGGKAQTVEAANAAAPSAQSGKGPLLHKQPDEGAQQQILLSIEQCGRGTAGNIDCWGYVTNQSDSSSKVALDHVDVVDGRGNSATLDRNGPFSFPDGKSSDVASGGNVKYTVTIPDKDPTAKTLTLYVDLSKPKSLEYTFRDVPVAE
jgi:hypothetical protein